MPPLLTKLDDYRQWHESQVRTFVDLRPSLEPAAENLRSLLKRLCAEQVPDAVVYVRVKSVLSVSEKILRGNNPHQHPQPLDLERGLSDLIGGQIVTYTQRDQQAICDLIEQLGATFRNQVSEYEYESIEGLEIDDCNSVGTASRLLPDQFGYTARHFIIRLHGKSLLGTDISSASACKRKMEVQVTPALAFAWNVVTHDRTYKSDLTLPDHLKRRVAEAKALLDSAQRQLDEAIVELDRYRKKHAGRLLASVPVAVKPDEMDDFKRAKLVSDSILNLHLDTAGPHANTVVGALESRAELAMAQSDWSMAISLLDRAVKQRPSLRVRLAEAHQHAGNSGTAQTLLDDVLESDPAHPAAACARGELSLAVELPTEDDYEKAAQVLDPAFLASPHEPELLIAYATARLLRDRDAGRLCTMRGVFEAATTECRKRHDLGSEIPECLLQHARLALYADDLFEALNTYCLAALHQPTEARIQQELHHIHLLRERVTPDPAEPRVGALRVGLECAEALLSLIQRIRGGRSSTKTTEDHAQKLTERFGQRPIVLIAGGCDQRDEPQLARFISILESALGRFQGTLISGGTTAGISGLVGQVAKASADAKLGTSGLRAIGYSPSASQINGAKDRIDHRYHELIHVTPQEPGKPIYSPLGPIQTWRDLLDAGVVPQDVRLIGINGGKLSAFEYRLALILGGTVGLIEDSGRAVTALLDDPHWNRQPSLARLIRDAETIELFVNANASLAKSDSAALDVATVEQLAMRFHEDYRTAQLKKPENVHPSTLPWGKLPDVYRKSNLQQAASLAWILQTESFLIVPVTDPRPAIDLGIDAPSETDPHHREPHPDYADRVERMARLEHARWNAERLALGWTAGPQRNLERKTSPYLVPYDDLPSDIRRYDQGPFLLIAQLLREVSMREGQGGWKIVDGKSM